MVLARPSPPPYRRLPDRKKTHGQLVSLVLPKAQLRRARRMAKQVQGAGSAVFRVALGEWLNRHEPQARRRKAES